MRKLLEDLTPHRPFGFETSFSAELADHTAMKPEALLEAKASAAVADNAAFIFIDAIDPIGTLNPKVYDRMGRIFDRLMPVLRRARRQAGRGRRRVLQPRLQVRFRRQRPARARRDTTDAHTKSVTSVTRALGSRHIPFGFITKTTLSHLNEHKVLILPDVNMMDDAEIAAIREWVRRGGKLLATGWTSIVDTRGGLARTSAWATSSGSRSKRRAGRPGRITSRPGARVSPPSAISAAPIRPSPGRPARRCRHGPGSDVAVLATTTLVWPAGDPSRFSSIHSNPPWRPTDRPEVVLNRFGQGRAIYCASPIETIESLADPSSGWCGGWTIDSPSGPTRRRPSS